MLLIPGDKSGLFFSIAFRHCAYTCIGHNVIYIHRYSSNAIQYCLFWFGGMEVGLALVRVSNYPTQMLCAFVGLKASRICFDKTAICF